MMFFETARIENYKSFRDSGEFRLAPRRTVIVGRNDAGKSSLLEALSVWRQLELRGRDN